MQTHNEVMVSEKLYPNEENLGKNCMFWQGVDLDEEMVGKLAVGCYFPKFELEGRTSCEGIVDDVCLYIKSGRHPTSLSKDQIYEIQFKVPDFKRNNLPPGDII